MTKSLSHEHGTQSPTIMNKVTIPHRPLQLTVRCISIGVHHRSSSRVGGLMNRIKDCITSRYLGTELTAPKCITAKEIVPNGAIDCVSVQEI